MMMLTVPMAMSSRPKVTPPLAKLSATRIGFLRISGFRKLRTRSTLSAIIADPAGEKPRMSAMTTIEIGTMTRMRLIQS